jgi:hypothetical protein
MNRRVNVRALLPVTILILAVSGIIAGILRGEATEIYQKSINLCLACIGIG